LFEREFAGIHSRERQAAEERRSSEKDASDSICSKQTLFAELSAMQPTSERLIQNVLVHSQLVSHT